MNCIKFQYCKNAISPFKCKSCGTGMSNFENKQDDIISDLLEQIDLKTDEYTYHYNVPTKVVLEQYADEVKRIIEKYINKILI